MLLYYNKSFLGLLVERRGSVFYRPGSLFVGVFLSALGGALQYWRDRREAEDEWAQWAPDIFHHYGFQAVGAGVTFAIVFRTQLAWNRYWEAVTQLHFMYSKWADAFSQFQAFAEVTKKAANGKGDTVKADRIRQKQKRIKVNYALLSAFAADRLTAGDNQRMEEVRVSRARTRATMRVDKEQERFSMPEMIERQDHDRTKTDDGLYVVFGVPSDDQVRLLARSFDTVATIMYWIIWDLADAMKDIDIAPPIQSRMYQELSNGMLGFNNCLKIADVPFPLPFAQLLGMLLVAFSAFIPVYVIVFTRSPIAGPILCFLLFESLWCLNEVAKELENPFGHDSNDITLSDFHLNFVDSLEDISMAEQQVLLHMPIVLPEESLPNCSEEVPSEVPK